ncbi:MAG: sterol desaturase family protein [Gemmatimonadaceae bacterium]
MNRPAAAAATSSQPRRSPWIAAALGLGAAGALVWAERRRALRARSAPTGERTVTNLVLAGGTAAVAALAMGPAVRPLTRWAERERVGVAQQLRAPAWLRDALAVILLDYTLYWWHVVEHRVPWLYRFHEVHHTDLDLDASTALRFHFGEFLLSIPWRAAQIVTIGVSPRALGIWQQLTALSVLFHHSNVELPLGVERRLARVIMTPRLHGIHHSIVAREQDSNWSSGLTIWDRLHRTYRGNVRQREIVIGVPALRDRRDVTLAKSVALPFAAKRAVRATHGGARPRAGDSEPRGRLLP